jgi:hypothetical protein
LLACSAIRATQLSKFGSCQSVCSMRRAVESFCSQRVYQWLELPPPRPGAMRMSRSDVFSGFAFQGMVLQVYLGMVRDGSTALRV